MDRGYASPPPLPPPYLPPPAPSSPSSLLERRALRARKLFLPPFFPPLSLLPPPLLPPPSPFPPSSRPSSPSSLPLVSPLPPPLLPPPSYPVRPLSIVIDFHISNFFSRTAWWILMKLGRDEVLMAPYKYCCFSARSAQDQNTSRGSPSSDRKATGTNQMLSNDLEACGKKCSYFTGKNRGRASPLTKSSFRPNIHSNILAYCRRHMHLFESSDSCHSGCLFFWLNCLLLVIRWGVNLIEILTLCPKSPSVRVLVAPLSDGHWIGNASSYKLLSDSRELPFNNCSEIYHLYNGTALTRRATSRSHWGDSRYMK